MTRRSFFTLIEMLVVMALLVTVAGFAGVNITKLLREQRFLTGVEAVTDQVRLAEMIMLVFDCEATLQLEVDRSNGSLVSHIEVDQQLPEPLEHLLKEPFTIAGIRSLGFEEDKIPRQVDKLSLGFSSISMTTPKGILYLSGETSIRGKLSRQILFSGYPSPFGIAAPVSTSSSLHESETLFPKEIREDFLRKNSPSAA